MPSNFEFDEDFHPRDVDDAEEPPVLQAVHVIECAVHHLSEAASLLHRAADAKAGTAEAFTSMVVHNAVLNTGNLLVDFRALLLKAADEEVDEERPY